VYWQWSPAVGFDGTNFLVAWTDERSGSSDIYGARVTPQGTVLDPSGCVISQAAYCQESPALGFDGANFLVVWQHGRGGSADIYGARVTPQGTVLDPSGFVISQAASSQYGPALGFDGANFLVVWEDYRSGSGGSDIYGARVTPQGTVLDPSGFVISQAAYEQLSPALGFDGANFLVVWHDYRSRDYHIYGTRVTPQGTVLTPDGFVISQGEYGEAFPALGFDGANFLVVWYAYGVGPRICGARVTPAGTVLDPSGIPISPRGGTQAVVFDGVDYFVVWRDYRGGGFDFYGARVSPGGVVFDSGPVVRQEGGQNRPKLARGAGSQLFLVYEGWVGMVGDKSYNTQRIWGKMDPSTGVVGTPIYEVRTARVEPTIVRGVLLLSDDRRPGTGDRAALLDIAGRSVMRLQPGANDVRALAPGVYFVRSKPSAVTKVVVQR
ncbi:MAG: hypothetical protein NTX53_00790, partial [candidate division WOR-3 bacterium]|nr:hypothetical protein [candidate division WOR-3 bacterium]